VEHPRSVAKSALSIAGLEIFKMHVLLTIDIIMADSIQAQFRIRISHQTAKF
jgi:hypothetical protein